MVTKTEVSAMQMKNGRSRTKYNGVPPLRNLRIMGHESRMDIRLLMHSTSTLRVNLFSKVQATQIISIYSRTKRHIYSQSMCQRCCNTSKRETIRYGKRRRNEQRAVGFVCLFVESRIGAENARDIIGVSGVIKGTTGRDRHVHAPPGIRVLHHL